MLGPLETLLLPAIAAALGPAVEVVAGPAGAPAGGSPGRIAVHALRLVCASPPDTTEAPLRDAAFRAWQGRLEAAPDQPLDFPLPADAPGELAEVHCPPGRLLAAGDAYLLDGRVLRFFRPPPGPVLARTRGAPCAGYRERRDARIDLELRAWSPDAAALDEHLAHALGAVLACCEGLDVLALASAAPRLALRLGKPRATLDGIERAGDPDAPDWQFGLVRCSLVGELELTLNLGSPAPQGVIRDVAVKLHAPGKPLP